MKTSSFRIYGNKPGAISIAVYPPKWYHGLSFPALAPGKEWFRMTDRGAYTQLYQQILNQLDPADVWRTLHSMAGNTAEPVLLCWENPPFTETNWCHRRMVADWFKEFLHKDVLEYTPPHQETLFDF